MDIYNVMTTDLLWIVERQCWGIRTLFLKLNFWKLLDWILSLNQGKKIKFKPYFSVTYFQNFIIFEI